MTVRILILPALSALAAIGASAQGFLPVGGYTATSHYALETLTAGYVSTDQAVLSHGSLPAVSTNTSGVESVAVNGGDIKVYLSAAGRSAVVEGAPDGCRYQLFGISGIMLADGRLGGNSVAMDAYPAGHYLLRVMPDSQTPCTKHLLKQQ